MAFPNRIINIIDTLYLGA